MPTRFAPLSRIAIVIVLSLLSGCSSNKMVATSESAMPDSGQAPEPLHYTIDPSPQADDLFHVTLQVDDLSESNAVYQFASTAPGTYQVHDIGRFVRSFSAVDADGSIIPTEQTSTNQWTITDPADVARIEYAIAETWDTPVGENTVYRMSGTSIETDHALINGHAVLGYPTGMQNRPLEITIKRDSSWVVGTALRTDEDGDFMADDYDHVVDSPILIGRLSHAELDVGGSQVEIYTYSKTDQVHSDQILEATRHILESAGEFLGELPVDRYAFLFHFEDVSVGAWEHSYSSEYVFAEANFDQAIRELIPDVVAHEFFHIVTPLNIHSEVIEEFNFVEPVPSEHLWLYEGTTEWAAHVMQLRSGLITLEQYLDRMRRKLMIDDQYNKNYSLSKLSLTSYTPEGQQQYGNIYMRGALVAGLLDIRLLELSGGTRGLREVLGELSSKYGPDEAFDEETFFEEFTEVTYPEIGDFFEQYVKNAGPLPIAEYYRKIGISYNPETATGEQVADGGIQIMFNGEAFAIGSVNEHAAECGFVSGDVLKGFNGRDVTVQNIQEIATAFAQVPANVEYELTISRDGEEKTIACEKVLIDRVEPHVFTVIENPAPEQMELREAWMKNLPTVNP